MAKNILRVFGFLSVLQGIILIVAGLQERDGIAVGLFVCFGSAFLLAGAPLLGFARVIGLLEKIERNTQKETQSA